VENKYPTITNCYQCGSAEITQYCDEDINHVVACWHCGHRVCSAPSATQCPKCGHSDAIDFYDSADGVVFACPRCGHNQITGQTFPIFPKKIKCPQCEGLDADEIYDESEDGVLVLCSLCGRTDYIGNVIDDKTTDRCGWKHEVKYGAGCLHYRLAGQTLGSTIQPLHTLKEVDDAERQLREKLKTGEYESGGTYLTRWNQDTRQAELVVGSR
jgi:Zn ribbon nucleic-acid-binding protein